MKRHFGQAGLVVADIAHGLARLFLLLLTLLLLSICLLGLRLAAGPLEIPYLASKLATIVSGQGITVKIQKADLAWAGYRQGGGVPLIFLLGGIAVTNSAGVELVAIPSATLSFLPVSLLGPDAPILVTATDARFPGSAVPASLRAAIRLNTGFSLSRAELAVTLGAGRLGRGANSFPIRSGAFAMTVTPASVAVRNGVIDAAASGGSAPVITFAGAATRMAALWNGSLRVTMDRVQVPDLPAYWPPGILPQTRSWIIKNMTAGRADHGDVTAGLSAPLTLAAVNLVTASGGFDGENLTMNWIPGAQPITDMNGKFRFLDAGDALVSADSARLGGLALSAGRLKISGLMAARQFGDLRLHVAGTVPDVIAVLGAPPLSLLRTAPPEIARATGQVAADVAANIPFATDLTLAQTAIHVATDLSDVAVDSPFPGLRFTGGAGELTATADGLTVQATASFAGEPAKLAVAVAFNAPPAVRSVHLRGAAGPAVLRFLGVDAPTALSAPVTGTAPFQLLLTTAADGSQTLSVDADLTAVALAAPPFGWTKPAGVPGDLAASAAFEKDAPGALLSLRAQAPGLDVQGQAAGRNDFVVTRANIGRTRAAGEILGPAAGGAWLVKFAGPLLEYDIAPAAPKGQKQPAAPSPPAPNDAPLSGPVWSLALNFDQLALAAAPAPLLQKFRLAGDLTGAFVRQAKISARGVTLTVQPAAAGGPRRDSLALRATDGGALLRAAGLYGNLQGGALALDEDEGGSAPAQGVVHLEHFRLMKVPVMAKILQGLTIYGIGAATSGPGLQFDHLVAPFTVDQHVLTLAGARAYSDSLGFTASGTVRLDDGVADLDATVVPAYALNALPGKIPVIGPLFTAETGGGLVSVRVRILGALGDPSVMVNPLSALTPGVFRNLFGTGGSH